ncbi:MAG: AtzE family amidohydrolase, partial [Rhodospirillaceae bacterium]|nr:AtzE family amidohydrolase [Rhodospirillaceae bacterium]
PVSADRPAVPTSPDLGKGAAGLRIGVADGYFATGGAPEAHRAVEAAADALGATKRFVVKEAARARAAAYVITATEGAALHLKRLRRRAADFDPATRDRFIAGAAVPAAWYVQAQRFRRWYHAQLLDLFRDVDVLLTPATPVTAPLIGQQTMVLDGVEMAVRPNLGIFTQPISFAGLPVTVVPLAAGNGLPIGVQIIAAPWREADSLRVAYALERLGIAQAPAAH